MKEKYAIINDEIHKLVKIKKDETWDYPWRIYEEKDLYWVPIVMSKPNEEIREEITKEKDWLFQIKMGNHKINKQIKHDQIWRT